VNDPILKMAKVHRFFCPVLLAGSHESGVVCCPALMFFADVKTVDIILATLLN
jgi:hypothetical protein